MIKILRTVCLVIWIISLFGFGYLLYLHPEYKDPKILLQFFTSFGVFAGGIYMVASLLRGIVLLPSMPLVLVGILLFPGNPHLVFLVSMMGIIFSGMIIYWFSDVMGFDELFAHSRYHKQIEQALDRYGFFAVTLWSFAPIVPTDIVCYIAGITRMNFFKFVFALTLGESLIVGMIVYGGSDILQRFIF